MIEIRNLYKKFGKIRVFNDLSLVIRDGETLAVLGKSGTGKTVLLKHIVGLLKPDSGEILVNGYDVTKMSRSMLFKLRRDFGFVFQASALFDSLTVFENLALALRERGLDNSSVKKRVYNILELVGLKGVENLYPVELSGGMQKRVSVARAIIYEPKYILYDEPTTGLDPITADTINDLIVDLKKRLKTTSILVTHDVRSALRVADRVALLQDGKIKTVVLVDEAGKTEDPDLRKFLSLQSSGSAEV